jgi:hypothetical protein
VAANSLKPHRLGMTAQGTGGYEIDEALWDAYRRFDKSAVIEKLLRRYVATAPRHKTRARAVRKQGVRP